MEEERKRKRPTDEVDEQGESSAKKKQQSVKTDENLNLDTIPEEGKVFNDSVHGHIQIHPLLVSIIDTPEFQRLRFIRQLGMCYFIYPGATHNRFEHSIGVSYLAGELVRSLQRKQEELKITKEDILCVEVAGLCHDLGHGPFSHLFDDAFLPRVRPDYKEKHEKLSVDMFQHMLEKNNLRKEFTKYGLKETDITFITEQIVGAGAKQDVWTYKGRTKDRSFLYEIVANKRNGIDVDKWDYFARDSLYLGIKNAFDWRRSLKLARVLNVSGEMQICTRDKEITNLYDMFHTRYTLHRRAYQHRVNKILEAMIVDALIAANDHLMFAGKDGKMTKMSESIDDMEAYNKLTDHVMWMIYTSSDKKLDKAKDLIHRIMKRDLYECVGQTQLNEIKSIETPSKQRTKINKENSEREIYNLLNDEAKKKLDRDGIVVYITSYNYGMGEKDPVEYVKFYSKYNPKEAVEKSILSRDFMALPRQFSEGSLRVCIKQKEERFKSWVTEAFEAWCGTKGLRSKPVGSTPTMSPSTRPRISEQVKPEAGSASREINLGLSTP